MIKQVKTSEIIAGHQVIKILEAKNKERAAAGRDEIILDPKFVYALNKNLGKCKGEWEAYVKAAQALASANPKATPEELNALEATELAEQRDDSNEYDIHMIDIELVPVELAYQVSMLDFMIKEE